MVEKINGIDTSEFVLKTEYNLYKLGLEKKINDADIKISHTSGLVKKTDYDAKITVIEGKTLNVTGLVTATSVNSVKNKISDVSNLSKKTDYDSKILDIESKYFTASYYNKFANKKIDNKIK